VRDLKEKIPLTYMDEMDGWHARGGSTPIPCHSIAPPCRLHEWQRFQAWSVKLYGGVDLDGGARFTEHVPNLSRTDEVVIEIAKSRYTA